MGGIPPGSCRSEPAKVQRHDNICGANSAPRGSAFASPDLWSEIGSEPMAVSTPAPIPAAQERTHGDSRPVTVIEPPRPWVPLDLRELWEQRELVYFLAWRDIKVRYKQTALGASWAILQPVFAMVVFSIFFGQLGRIPSDGLPYPLWSFAGPVSY